MPDHTVPICNRAHCFFDKKRVEEVRQVLNLPQVTAENILEMFMDFVSDMNMSSSCKPVFLLAMFDNTDKKGRAPIDAVLKDFLNFYLQRGDKNLSVEKEYVRMKEAASSGEDEVCPLIQERFSPDGFNIGVNIGFTAGQTIMHVHVHLIPRYKGDVSDPVGGVRNVIPGKGNYLRKAHSQ